MMLYDFSQREALHGWHEAGDALMGGQSQGRLLPYEDGGAAVFTGEVTLAEGGGFASVRSPQLRLDLTRYAGITLRVRGDGKRYGFVIGCRKQAGIRYRMRFEVPDGVWTTLMLPFRGLVPTMFDSVLPMAPEPDLRDVSGCGLTIGEGQGGPFRLAIAQIAAYS